MRTLPGVDSYIQVSASSISMVGYDATRLYAVMSLRSAIGLWLEAGVKLNRHCTPKSMLTMATTITHQPYKRGQLHLAYNDLTTWINAMQAALPVLDSNLQPFEPEPEA